MNRKNRIIGSLVSLVLLFVSAVLMAIPELQEIALMLMMFVGGYVLSETMAGEIEEESDIAVVIALVRYFFVLLVAFAVGLLMGALIVFLGGMM